MGRPPTIATKENCADRAALHRFLDPGDEGFAGRNCKDIEKKTRSELKLQYVGKPSDKGLVGVVVTQKHQIAGIAGSLPLGADLECFLSHDAK